MHDPITYSGLWLALIIFSRWRRASRLRMARITGQSIPFKSSKLGWIAFFSVLSLSIWVQIQPTLFAWAALPLPVMYRYLGIVPLVLGMGLGICSENTLGSRWRKESSPDLTQDFTTEAAYAWVRHPMYAAFLLYFLSPMLFTSHALIGGLWFFLILIDVLRRIRKEDQALKCAYGEAYLSYAKHTPAIIPWRKLIQILVDQKISG